MSLATYAAWVLVVLSVTSVASADDTEKVACMAAHGDAQVLRKANHLRAARAKLETCAMSTCPALIASDCTQWLADVEQQQSSIVVAANDAAGRPIVDASVSIDGKVVATKLDGTAIDVDPGEHELGVRSSEGESSVQRIVARESEKARLVRIQLPVHGRSSMLHQATPSVRRIPAASWVLGGVALAAAIPWGVFGVLGLTEKADLDSTCKGTCSLPSIDDVRRDFNVADIAGGVALAAIVGAVLVAILAPSRSRTLSAAMTPGGSLALFTQGF